ncbi:hypothetical protein C8Q74DRAFT_489046 [Fomes fomentarius]|nr:hypothetical protein C8Q74DRAFT_489046 [Fomes fomentarius]
MLNSNRDAAQSYSFSSMTDDHLTKLRISPVGFLELKNDLQPHLAKNDALGADGLWSADMLYRHLQYLEGLVPRQASFNHSHIIARYISSPHNCPFRMKPQRVCGSMLSSTALPRWLQMARKWSSVLKGIPSAILSDESPPVSGYIHHWAAIATSPLQAARFLRYPRVGDLRSEDSTLFVSEAKGPNQLLESHVPQAICEMYGCARTVGDGGGTYLQSDEISTHTHTAKLSRAAVSLVSSIIADWMTHSHEGFGADDAYFTSAVL